MNTGKASFQTILNEPDADEPRLVYADWLAENGESLRAEFIRLAVRIHQRGNGGVRVLCDPEGERYFDIERNQGQVWLKEMPEFKGIRWWNYYRGFPTIQATGWSALKKYAPKIWQLSPCEELDLYTLSEPAGRFFGASPWLEKLRSLSFSWIGRQGIPGFRAFLQAPRLGHLLVLNLKSNGLGDEGAKLLAECPHLVNLRELVLECNDIGDVGARALAGTPHFPKLKELCLGRNPIKDKEVERELKARWGKRYR